MTTEQQRIIAGMSDIELSMLRDAGMDLPASLRERIERHRRSLGREKPSESLNHSVTESTDHSTK